MKTEKLFELLTLVNGVNSERFETLRSLREIISKGYVDFKEKKWGDHLKQRNPDWYPLDLTKDELWCTYDSSYSNYGHECIDLYFYNDTTKCNGHENNQLVCKAKIYEGDNMYGRRKSLRFEALLWLPTAFIHNIEYIIESKFNKYLEEKYEEHLENEKRVWIFNLKSKIIGL